MARIPSEDVPQADALADVLVTVRAVANGQTSFQQIARAIGKVDRQGRYYRRAAEILGLIEPAGINTSRLTAKGNTFLQATPGERTLITAESVLGSTLVQRIIPFLEARRTAGATREEIQNFVVAVTERAGPTMVPRRIATVIAWLEAIGMLTRRDDRYYLGSLPGGILLVDYGDPGEPLLPPRFDLQEYNSIQRSVERASDEITYSIDTARRERASRAHQLITDLVAERIRACGAIPRRNQYIDLATKINVDPFIFEIKSTTQGNTHSQIRQGVSQLYEYRYMQGTPNASIVLVLENPIPDRLNWMMDYLVTERGIFVVWDGDHQNLRCDRRQRRELCFLVQNRHP